MVAYWSWPAIITRILFTLLIPLRRAVVNSSADQAFTFLCAPNFVDYPSASLDIEAFSSKKMVKFRLADKRVIDFLGVEDHTVNEPAGPLTDSNQRQAWDSPDLYDRAGLDLGKGWRDKITRLECALYICTAFRRNLY